MEVGDLLIVIDISKEVRIFSAGVFGGISLDLLQPF
jgi:hypothetical protein